MFIRLVALGCLSAALAACGASPKEAEVDDGTPVSGDATRGQALAVKSSCTSCHQADYGGAGFNPNITPDERTGIGEWSDEQIGRALTAGEDDDGDALCGIMERFAFTKQQTADVVAYLRSLPAVSRQNQSECPGHGATGH